MTSLRVEVAWSWWVTPYLRTCIFFAILTGLDPDLDKIVHFAVRHGMRLKVCG